MPRDDSEVYVDDGFAIGNSEALIPRFEHAQDTRPYRKTITQTNESGRAGALVRISANTIRRKGSGDGKARSPNQDLRVANKGNMSPPQNRALHSSVLGATTAVQGARSNPRVGSPSG